MSEFGDSGVFVHEVLRKRDLGSRHLLAKPQAYPVCPAPDVPTCRSQDWVGTSLFPGLFLFQNSHRPPIQKAVYCPAKEIHSDTPCSLICCTSSESLYDCPSPYFPSVASLLRTRSCRHSDFTFLAPCSHMPSPPNRHLETVFFESSH